MSHWNIEKKREYARLWMQKHRRDNPEKCKEIRRVWIEKNKEHIQKVRRAWRLAHSEKIKEQNLRRKKYIQAHREYFRELERARRERLRKEIRANYGNECVICGATSRVTLDHTNGDGGEFRQSFKAQGLKSTISGIRFYRWLRKHGYPKNLGLRVLCLSCNSRRNSREWKKQLANSTCCNTHVVKKKPIACRLYGEGGRDELDD